MAVKGKKTVRGKRKERKNIEHGQAHIRSSCNNTIVPMTDKAGNAVIYDNWRVPTEAELKIIEELQGTKESNPDAIDYLLNGYWYMCSNGMVKNENHESSYNSSSVCAVRCVRDAYDDK